MIERLLARERITERCQTFWIFLIFFNEMVYEILVARKEINI